MPIAPAFLIVVVILALIVLFAAIKVLNEYERGVVFTLGRFTASRDRG